MKKIALLFLAVPLFLFSCQDALDELTSIATFESTITGDVEKQFDGTAAFVHVKNESTTPNGSVLSIALSHLTDQSELISLSISNETTTGVVTGTYKVDVLANNGYIFLPIYNTEDVSYNLASPNATNTVTISSITDLRVKGEFEINVFDFTSSKKVKIVGTFDAAGTTETK